MASDPLPPSKRPLRLNILSVLQFCRNFIELAVILGVLWWLALPYYGQALAQLSAGVLVNVFGIPIEFARVEPAGTLNTGSVLLFGFEGRQLPFPVALLVTNMAPYLALVLATPRLGVLRRLVILVAGAAILVAGHIAFVVFAFYFRESIAQAQDVPYAVAQFYLTLPFLLWIVLAYWGKIARYLTENETGGHDEASRDP